jgi:hypothetical protein
MAALKGDWQKPKAIDKKKPAKKASTTENLHPEDAPKIDWDGLARTLVINGFSDLLTPFLGAAGAEAGATGWWSIRIGIGAARIYRVRSGINCPIRVESPNKSRLYLATTARTNSLAI